MNYISTLFPYWEKPKILSQTWRFLKFGWWEFFPKKETCNQNIDYITRTLNMSKILFVPHFLIEKNPKYFSWSSNKWQGKNSKKGNMSSHNRNLYLDHVSPWQLCHPVQPLLPNHQIPPYSWNSYPIPGIPGPFLEFLGFHLESEGDWKVLKNFSI